METRTYRKKELAMNIKSILKAHRYKFIFTLLLILLEAGIAILFPLFIGYAIDDGIQGNYTGAIQLGALGVTMLIIGVGRRVFDSRFYARVFQKLGVQIISSINDDQASVKTARLGMVQEMIEFFENAIPELINNIIGLVGVIIIIATLNINIFYGSLIVTVLIFLIYVLSSKKTIQYNKLANDEVEKQVDIVGRNNSGELKGHLKNLMHWNIKLSDIEALNFSFSWIVAIVFLVLSIVISVSDGIVKYGALFSLVMYVFQYIENVISLPMFYQNWLRLREIKDRMEQV